MGTEIERKFLVVNDEWRTGATGVYCHQGYLAAGPPAAIRVRIMGEVCTLNIKQATRSIVRDEFEYTIPRADAEALLQRLTLGHPIEKTRYRVPFAGLTWEVDEFHGVNAGLIIAEVELTRADQPIALPPWVGEEVSHDIRYFNSSLAGHPFTHWGC